MTTLHNLFSLCSTCSEFHRGRELSILLQLMTGGGYLLRKPMLTSLMSIIWTRYSLMHACFILFLPTFVNMMQCQAETWCHQNIPKRSQPQNMKPALLSIFKIPLFSYFVVYGLGRCSTIGIEKVGNWGIFLPWIYKSLTCLYYWPIQHSWFKFFISPEKFSSLRKCQFDVFGLRGGAGGLH